MNKKGVHDKFFSLLSQMPGASKEDMVWQYSGMLTTSLREFYAKKPEEYKRMVADLAVKAASKRAGQDQDIKKLRSAILKRLQQHGVDTADWTRVNTFLAQPRIAGKLLFEMDANEMRKLIAKLEQIFRKDAEVREYETKLSECN